jgi:hypothetical protein
MPPCAQGVRVSGAAAPARAPGRAPACAASRPALGSPRPAAGAPARAGRSPPLPPRATPNVSGTAAAATAGLPALRMPWCIEPVEELADEYRTAPKAHPDEELAALLAVPEAPKPVPVEPAPVAAAPVAAPPGAAVEAPASAAAPTEAVVPPAAAAPPSGTAVTDRGVLLRARLRWTEPFEEGKRVTLWGSWDAWAKARARAPPAQISMRCIVWLRARDRRRAAATFQRHAVAARVGWACHAAAGVWGALALRGARRRRRMRHEAKRRSPFLVFPP